MSALTRLGRPKPSPTSTRTRAAPPRAPLRFPPPGPAPLPAERGALPGRGPLAVRDLRPRCAPPPGDGPAATGDGPEVPGCAPPPACAPPAESGPPAWGPPPVARGPAPASSIADHTMSSKRWARPPPRVVARARQAMPAPTAPTPSAPMTSGPASWGRRRAVPPAPALLTGVDTRIQRRTSRQGVCSFIIPSLLSEPCCAAPATRLRCRGPWPRSAGRPRSRWGR